MLETHYANEQDLDNSQRSFSLTMEIQAFTALVLPFISVVYLTALLLLRPPRPVLLASLLAGLLMGMINILFDILAYYAHWWHYTLNGLILHVPVPFYITPILVYGSIVFLLIWRYWNGRGHWFALLLLIATPFFKAGTEILGALVSHTGYANFDSVLAAPLDVVMWLIMFYAGFFVFKLLLGKEPRTRKQHLMERK
jgi:hypothetical protein